MAALSNILQQVFLVANLFVVTRGCGSLESLKFENRSASLLKGCYCHNESLYLCFEIQPGFLQLTDKNNNFLVRLLKLPLQRFLAQVLGNNFLWWVVISFLLPRHKFLYVLWIHYVFYCLTSTLCLSR